MNDVSQYKKRRTLFWVGTVLLVLAWYGATAVESVYLGPYPYGRRGFSLFDWVLYAVLIGSFVLLYRWHTRCPKCKRRMKGSVYSPRCLKCGFGSAS